MKMKFSLLIMMLLVDTGARIQRHTALESHRLLKTHSNKQHKLKPVPRKAVCSTMYKYDEPTRAGLLATSLTLLVITISLLVFADHSPNGMGSGSTFEMLAALTGIGSLAMYMSHNAYHYVHPTNSTNSTTTTTKKRRNLSIRKQQETLLRGYRRLYATKGISKLYSKIRIMMKKEDLSKVKSQKPKEMFKFVKNFIHKKFPAFRKNLRKTMAFAKKLTQVSF